ncbi:DoxX family protein [Actinomadura sp. NPDC047616]|uniref:DoxX family protein n=1 Tax=Actinomadura sp. NPDC047616 TaxID=3155914 RepID=UPI0033F6F474
MNVALWTAQILLAAVFLVSGIVKSIWSKPRLIASGQTGVAPFPLPVVRLTAIAELLAVVGLIAPRATGIAPVLTPAAAGGLAIIMIGAAASHTRLLRADRRAGRPSREARNVAVNLIIPATCVFVAVGRL